MCKNEEIQSLKSFVDTEFFKNIVDSCRDIFNCKISLLSVVDERAQKQLHWAQAGLSSMKNAIESLPLSHSICKTVIATGETLMLDDTKKNDEFISHPGVHAFNFRSYLGVPIKDDENDCIAALCVIDTKVRKWTDDDLKILKGFAAGLSTQLQQIIDHGHGETVDENHTFCDDESLNIIKTNISFQKDQNGLVTLLYADPNYFEIWEKTPDVGGSTPFDLFDLCVPENMARVRASLGAAAMRESVWHQRWAIKSASGVEKKVSGVGHSKSLPGGFTVWHVLITAADTRNKTFVS